MLIKIGNFEFTEVWDGVLYKKLSQYPAISDWEKRNIIEFIEYEASHGRSCAIECENAATCTTSEVLACSFLTCYLSMLQCPCGLVNLIRDNEKNLKLCEQIGCGYVLLDDSYRSILTSIYKIPLRRVLLVTLRNDVR